MRRRQLLLQAAIAVAVAAVLWVRAPAPVHSDFCSYYAAGRLVLEGRAAAAYDGVALEQAHRQVHDIGRRAGPFLYSPLALAPAAAFAVAPLPAAAAVNRALGAVALGIGLLALLVLLESWPVRGTLAAALAVAHPAAVAMALENWSTWLFAGAAVGALALARRHDLAAGAAAAVSTHLKAFVLFAWAPLAAGARRRAVGWAAALGLALVLASAAAGGLEPWRRWAGFLAGRGDAGVTPYYNKCSLAANLARWTSEPREWVAARRPVESLPVRAVFWLGLPLLAWGGWRLRARPPAAFAFGLAWTLLFVPQVWEHTELLLFAALPALAARWRWAVLAGLGASALYGPAQQALLGGVLAGERPAWALGVLLLFYPLLNGLVLGAALASGGRAGRRSVRAS